MYLLLSSIAFALAALLPVIAANPVRPASFSVAGPVPSVAPGPIGNDDSLSNPHNSTYGDISSLQAPETIRRRDTTPGSSCVGKHGTVLYTYAVHISGQMTHSAQGTGEWGGGFLDNLRGQCGVIADWTANLDGVAAPHTGIECSFSATIFYVPQQIHDAAWLASDPNNRVDLACGF